MGGRGRALCCVMWCRVVWWCRVGWLRFVCVAEWELCVYVLVCLCVFRGSVCAVCCELCLKWFFQRSGHVSSVTRGLGEKARAVHSAQGFG